MLEYVILVITLVVLYQWLNLKPKNFPPGPPTIPILGSVLSVPRQNFHLALDELRAEYGPVIGMKFGPMLAAVICGPDEVFEVLKRDDFSSRPSIVARFRKAEGVMFSVDEAWKTQRRFTLRHLRDFGFGKTSAEDMVRMEFQEFSKYRLENCSEVEATGLFNTSAINVLWAMIGGTRFSYNDQRFQILQDCLKKLFRSGSATGNIFTTFAFLKPLVSVFYELEVDRTDRLIKEFLNETIAEHKSRKSDRAQDFMDVYLAELDNPNRAESFTEQTFIEVCRDLFTAGTESSGNTLSFCLLYLILYPEWQDKLFEEIEEVLAGQPSRLEDRNSMPLVEAFLSEVMRCNPIAPMTVPHATSKDTTINGYNLPKDTFVHISLWTLLQDKNHWGDPENFRPDRFIKDGKFVKDPYMIVFGVGPRICLGESLARNFIFLFFTSIVQKYTFAIPTGAMKPSTVCIAGFTAAPQSFRVSIRPRKTN